MALKQYVNRHAPIKGHRQCKAHAERHRALADAWGDAVRITKMYLYERQPDGKPWSTEALAEVYEISPGTAKAIVRTALDIPKGDIMRTLFGYNDPNAPEDADNV
jgi:hypothetical protein